MSECTATRHNTTRAYREHGCKCPEIVARMRAAWSREQRQKSQARREARSAQTVKQGGGGMRRGEGHHNKGYQVGAWPTFLDDTEQAPACQGAPAEMFFDPASQETAKRVCAKCPLVDACLEWALSRPHHEVYGIWGGTNQDERRLARRRASKKAAA